MDCPYCRKPVTGRGIFCLNCERRIDMHPSAGVQQSGKPVAIERPAIITHFAVAYGFVGLLMIPGLIAMRKTVESSLIMLISLVLCFVFLLLSRILFKMSPLSRIILITASAIGLVGFPFGTIFNVVLLIYLFHPGVKALFSGKNAASLTPAERAAVAKLKASWWNPGMVMLFWGLLVVGTGVMVLVMNPGFSLLVDAANQQETAVTMKDLGSRLDRFMSAQRQYPEVSDVANLERQLQIEDAGFKMPLDAWGRPFKYYSTSNSYYYLVSAGRDGKFESKRTYRPGTTKSFDCDIVFRTGVLIRYAKVEKPTAVADAR